MNATTPQFSLKLPSGFQIEKNLSEKEVEACASDRQDMNTGYIWYTLPEEEIDETKVIFSLCFNRGSLESISLTLSDEKYGQDWSDWSEEKEKERAKDIGLLLSGLGYSPNSYEWGEVWASFDPRGGFGIGGSGVFKQVVHRMKKMVEYTLRRAPIDRYFVGAVLVVAVRREINPL